jgi:hypothetical protein
MNIQYNTAFFSITKKYILIVLNLSLILINCNNDININDININDINECQRSIK